MSGQRGVDSDLSGFFIANLPDENNIGVLTQDRSEGLSKVKAPIWLDLNLFDTGNFILDRIFDGNDFFIRSIKRFENGVKRSGFTGTSWTGNDNHSSIELDCS